MGAEEGALFATTVFAYPSASGFSTPGSYIPPHRLQSQPLLDAGLPAIVSTLRYNLT